MSITPAFSGGNRLLSFSLAHTQDRRQGTAKLLERHLLSEVDIRVSKEAIVVLCQIWDYWDVNSLPGPNLQDQPHNTTRIKKMLPASMLSILSKAVLRCKGALNADLHVSSSIEVAVLGIVLSFQLPSKGTSPDGVMMNDFDALANEPAVELGILRLAGEYADGQQQRSFVCRRTDTGFEHVVIFGGPRIIREYP